MIASYGTLNVAEIDTNNSSYELCLWEVDQIKNECLLTQRKNLCANVQMCSLWCTMYIVHSAPLANFTPLIFKVIRTRQPKAKVQAALIIITQWSCVAKALCDKWSVGRPIFCDSHWKVTIGLSAPTARRTRLVRPYLVTPTTAWIPEEQMLCIITWPFQNVSPNKLD